ncbi:P-loop NTPase fold protein [Lentzea sp. HUAS TT2]|uniref:P-loop NTPase fold protein n=1 Tax=Lentzea sp. HUAS TT2 TaxID=3447454 RepID=UPI003F70B0F0
MTSADVPGIELERAIALNAPITELAIDDGDPENPVLWAFLDGEPPQTVLANTGDPFTVESTASFPNAAGSQRSLQVADLEVAADGADIVVTSSSDGVRRLTGHISPVTTLSLFPASDEPLLMSGSEGGSIRIWNPRTGEVLRQSQQCAVSVLLTYTGPDGGVRIASGGRNGELRVWNPLMPDPPRTGPVSTRGFSDRVAPTDLLDRGNLVSTLTEMLQPGDGDAPTVITVEGAWGSGKSTLLELVKTRLSTRPTKLLPGPRLTLFHADHMLWQPELKALKPPKRPPGKPVPKEFRTDPQSTPKAPRRPVLKPVVVSFNPWRHQSSEQVWAGLAKALAEAARPAIMPHQNILERYWFHRNARRVDRRHLQRQLWRRTLSPLLSFAGLGFGLSVLGALTKSNIDWAWWATGGLAAAGVLHTGLRYVFGRASAFLPGELFAGPVASNAFSGTATDPTIRDPYYHARSGYLYLVQHDVQELLKDLAAQNYQVILLIDDLDRCTPRTTAEVFEAINVFLSDDFPSSRFVLGLDTTVVASHVDHAYKELADANMVTHPDDPSPGWTFLRKLVQLPVRLPRTTADSVDQVLLAQLGPVHLEAQAGTPEVLRKFESAPARSSARRTTQKIIAIEQHPKVREHLRRRLRAQPEQSVREEKRLLNVWQFYLRMLSSVDVVLACHLVVVAEIAVRWPAYLHRLRGGWQDLADALDDDVRWGATIARLGFTYSDRKAAANLRDLLRDCDAQAVAALTTRLF